MKPKLKKAVLLVTLVLALVSLMLYLCTPPGKSTQWTPPRQAHVVESDIVMRQVAPSKDRAEPVAVEPFSRCFEYIPEENRGGSKVSERDGAPIIQQYLHNYRDHVVQLLENEVHPRILVYVYEPGGNGWGNQVRGLYSAFLLAMFSKRLLLVSNPHHEHAFFAPSGLRFFFLSEFVQYYGEERWLSLRRIALSASDLSLAPSLILDSWEYDVITYDSGEVIDYLYFGNDRYVSMLRLWVDRIDRGLLLQTVLPWMFEFPSNIMAAAISELRHAISFDVLTKDPSGEAHGVGRSAEAHGADPSGEAHGVGHLVLALQIRYFMDVPASDLAAVFANSTLKYLECVESVVRTLQREPSALKVYLSSDNALQLNRIQKHFLKMGILAAYNPFYYQSNDMLQIVNAKYRSERCLLLSIVDWYFMSVFSDYFFTTGTSYGGSIAFQRSRQQFQHNYFFFDYHNHAAFKCDNASVATL